MRSCSQMIRMLQRAINDKFNEKLLVNKNQWYSEEQKRPVTTYILRKAIYDEEKQRTQNIEIFKSTSQIQLVLYLRDYWYELNGWKVPGDNIIWDKKKEEIASNNREVI